MTVSEDTVATAEINGKRLAYYDSGQGRPIMFIHSFNQSKLTWFTHLSYFVERGYRVIAPDIPGHGGSDFVANEHNIPTFAESFLVLMDQLEIDRCYVVGASLGGYIAFSMLSQSPDRIAGLVLSGTKAAPDSDLDKERRRKQITELRNNGLSGFISGINRRLSSKTLEKDPWTFDFMKALSLEGDVDSIAATLEAMINKVDDRPMLSSIEIPTLIIVGDEDTFTPVERSNEMHDKIKGSEMVVMKNASHYCFLDDPLFYDLTISDFLVRNGWL